MSKALIYTETLLTSIEPERTARLADECLVEVRFIEERKVANAWIYEYEVKGDAGKIAKFFSRVKDVENGV